jgi:hypothetical protein
VAEKLGIGARFPDMTIACVDRGPIRLPSEAIAKYGVVLFYRGHW